MFKRKLLALDYPTPDKFNINDENEFRSVVLWLEDQKIRHYKVQDRSRLRDIRSPNWPDAYRTYLNDVACLVKSQKKEEELEWLLAFAVRLEYGDNADKYKNQNITPNNLNAPKVVSTNPLDNLDFQSADFIKGVNLLADMLKITQHPDHLVTLKAISKLVKARLSQEVLANPNSVIIKGTPFPFQDADSGFDMDDYVLNNAAKIMRLLYIHNLRDLQTQINECIVAVQSLTANPKTDTKLGQVGR
ncbi:UNVERIFIED_CONTAM: hypothetical protein PYX00_007570 [Menopon gallinae]|uniref:RNA transcription, translation and transport factor protein n=1 Tax=Menopon gallinae TaxID=328185 RepID=A0AAW2HK51_9NEOP